MRLDDIPRISLTALPTPLDEAPNLAKELRLRKLLVKRDDCTTLAMGGNKARKLEYLMAEALAQNADVVLTDGGPQSNHARMTAAAARKLGVPDVMLFLGGPRFERFDGNLLLDVVLGADIRYMTDANVKDMEQAMADEAERLRSAGRRPYVIPIGGSSPLGALGYVRAMRELAGQLDEADRCARIFVAVGSAGTLAGCGLGLRLFLPDAELTGISVARASKPLRQAAASVANGAAELLGVRETFTESDFAVNDSYYGKFYGVPTEAGNKAVLLTARTEGLILDPVYTGKAMSGLIDLARASQLDSDRPIIFIHTGGAPGLMAFEGEFRGLARLEVKWQQVM